MRCREETPFLDTCLFPSHLWSIFSWDAMKVPHTSHCVCLGDFSLFNPTACLNQYDIPTFTFSFKYKEDLSNPQSLPFDVRSERVTKLKGEFWLQRKFYFLKRVKSRQINQQHDSGEEVLLSMLLRCMNCAGRLKTIRIMPWLCCWVAATLVK